MDYVLSERDRKVHEIGLDLLKKLKSICEKYNLNYLANAGTLLGAARHKGFIPWDDDIDVSMDWKDYKTFLQVAPRECQYPYFFQSHLTEEGAEVDHVKIRRSDTTGFSKWEYENIKDPNHNLGIWIDIFPLFSVPDEIRVREEKKAKIMALWKAIRGYNSFTCVTSGSEPNHEYIQYMPIYQELSKKMTITEIKQQFLEECIYYDDQTDEIGETSLRTYNDKFIYKRLWYAGTIDMPFENTTIHCPARYDEILTKAYGNWRIPILNGAVHEMEHVDPDTPFKVYLEQKGGMK